MTTPAVVLGSDTNALGVIRSLGQGHVPTLVVDDKPAQPAMHSRYARHIVVKSMSGEALIRELLSLTPQLPERPLLFMTNDVQVSTISEHRRHLKETFRLRLPEHEVVRTLLHKATFQGAAEQHGFTVPRSVAVHGEMDLPALRALEFPVIIKPALQQYALERDVERNYKARTLEEADAFCREAFVAVNDLIVQEWIEGRDSDIYFCLQYRGSDGATVSSFTGRKLRCWPPERGNTASCMPSPEVTGELESKTTAFFDRLGFVGMGSMEFKRDRRSGRFFMIEPTVGRTDYQEEVATLNGINIPLTAYCHELNVSLPVSRTPALPVVWRDSPSYWKSVLTTGSGREYEPPRRRRRIKGVFWRLDDPVPSVYFLLRWFRKLPNTSWWALRGGKGHPYAASRAKAA